MRPANFNIAHSREPAARGLKKKGKGLRLLYRGNNKQVIIN